MSDLSNHNLSENDLINGSLSGDRRVQQLLYERFAPKMYAVCLRYSGNTDDAQDLLQEGFIKVFRNLQKFRKEGSFEGWVRRIFVNTAIEQYRRKTGLTAIVSDKEEAVEDGSWNALDRLAEKDIIMLVQQLSPGYRAVFNMYVIEGYSHKEIGGLLEISEGTSKSQLARAKGLLQKKVKEFLDNNRT